VVGEVVAFEDAPAAVQKLADGATTGRLVVRVP
jgi:NADPH2:quinone reductase